MSASDMRRFGLSENQINYNREKEAYICCNQHVKERWTHARVPSPTLVHENNKNKKLARRQKKGRQTIEKMK